MGLFFFGIFLSSSFSLFYLSLDKSPISLDFFFDSKSIFISGCFLFCRSRQIWLKSLNFAGDEFELRQMMQAAANLSVIWNLSLRGSSSKVHILSPKYQKSHALHCLRSEGHEEFENSPQENLGLSSVTKEIKHKDIWSLFKEAQQNIMFLNKQRLAAVEELKKLKKEKDELLERINQLEEESQIVIKKAACKPNMDWGGNTDLQKVFDCILDVAVENNLTDDEMIKRIYVFSDMEFDNATGNYHWEWEVSDSESDPRSDYQTAYESDYETRYEERLKKSKERSKKKWETDYHHRFITFL